MIEWYWVAVSIVVGPALGFAVGYLVAWWSTVAREADLEDRDAE